MYFPVLRGKQYELQAVEELCDVILENENVCPIIEPVNLNSLTMRIIKVLDEQQVNFVVLLNPTVGDLVGRMDDICKSLVSELSSYNTSMLGLMINQNSKLSDIEEIMNKFRDFNFALYHVENNPDIDNFAKLSNEDKRIKYHFFNKDNTSKPDRKKFPYIKRVIIEDTYVPAVKNADYPVRNEFSDIVFKFSKSYFGFGDYQTIGGRFTDSGGRAHAVALHLTDEDTDDNEMNILHFLSDDKKGAHNVQGKYFQALKKLCDYIKINRGEPITLGEQGFIENLNEGIYHGLGYPKKLSIMHHIHLMSELLK